MNFQRSSTGFALLVILCTAVKETICAPAGDQLPTPTDESDFFDDGARTGVMPFFQDEADADIQTNSTALTRKTRQRQSTTLHDQCEPYVFQRKITHPNCKTIHASVKGCRGACVSSAVPSTLRNGVFTSPEHPTMHENCRCCSPVETKIGRFRLNCSTPGTSQSKSYLVKVEVAVTCKCRSCGE